MELQYSNDPNSPQSVVFPADAMYEKQSRSKGRHHRESPTTTTYRINFHCDQIRSQRTSSKRKLTWRFGVCKRASWLDEGVVHCDQDEHEVVLIRFMRSGKTDVLWNGVNMSHSFREGPTAGMFEYAWQTRTGENLQFIGYPGSSEYDFLVDGTKFAELPDMNDLHQFRLQSSTGSERRSEDGDSVLSANGSDVCNDREADRIDPFDMVPYGSGFRLSLAGLGQGEEVEDELRSNLPSSTLDTLRSEIVSSLPDAEQMVSRAMLSALLDEAISITEPSVVNVTNDPFQIEAEMLKETYEWINIHRFCTDLDDMKFGIMQKHVDAAFAHVHRERLTVMEALRALLSVACVLRLKVSSHVANNTVILIDLDEKTTSADIIDALATFGEIECSAIVQGAGFGVCRFCLDTSVEGVCAASQEKRLRILGATPRVLPVTMSKIVERAGEGVWGNFESIADCDACLGAPLRYLISGEDDYDFHPRGFDFCGSMPSLRSVVSASSYPSTGAGAKLARGQDFVGKTSTSTDTMPTVVSIDSIASALTSMDSSYLTLCTSFER